MSLIIELHAVQFLVGDGVTEDGRPVKLFQFTDPQSGIVVRVPFIGEGAIDALKAQLSGITLARDIPSS